MGLGSGPARPRPSCASTHPPGRAGPWAHDDCITYYFYITFVFPYVDSSIIVYFHRSLHLFFDFNIFTYM